MISKELHEALNKQVNYELQAAYQYLAMAAYFDAQSLDGFAHWTKTQAQEELAHAMKIYNYLNDLGCDVTMLQIEKPRTEFSSPLDVFEAALENEKELARVLNDLSTVALADKDNTTYTFLEWFLTEQVEEVSLCSTVVDKLTLIGDNGYGILTYNNELGQRKPEEEE